MGRTPTAIESAPTARPATAPEFRLALLGCCFPPRACFGHVLERHVQLHPIAGDLSVLDGEVLLHHLGHPEVAQRLGRGLDGGPGRRLPGLAAGPYQLSDPIHAVGHHDLLSIDRWIANSRAIQRRAARTFASRSSSPSLPMTASLVQWSSCIVSNV